VPFARYTFCTNTENRLEIKSRKGNDGDRDRQKKKENERDVYLCAVRVYQELK
jgi:hypothetical protein